MSKELNSAIVEIIASADALAMVRTTEPDDVLAAIAEQCRTEYSWDLWVWDADQGLRGQGSVVEATPKVPAGSAGMLAPTPPRLKGPSALVAAVRTLLAKPDDDDTSVVTPTIMVVKNLHRYWAPPYVSGEDATNVVQALQNFMGPAKASNKVILGIVPPSASPPEELYDSVTMVRHHPPGKDEFKAIIPTLEMDDVEPVKLTDEEVARIAAASCGLTRLQAEKAYSRSMTRHEGRILPELVEEFKREVLNADQMLLQSTGKVSFDDVGGCESLKAYLIEGTDPKLRCRAKKPIRGVCLVGPPGTGKSLTAKALAAHWKGLAFQVEMGKAKAKWMGESEANTRKTFDRLDVMAPEIESPPLVAFWDEVNEQFAGRGGDGGDEGHSVDKNQLQMMLVWLNDHTSNVFTLLTANDIRTLPPAMTRSGRINSTWYVGLPGRAQKVKIWEIMLAKFELPEQELPDDEGWAGAEIEGCASEADARGISLVQAARVITPTSVRYADSIEALKDLAERCGYLDAETGEAYRRDRELRAERTGVLPVGRPRRKVRKL